MKRNGISYSTNLPRNHVDGAKFAHATAGTQNHTVKQTPLDIRQSHAKKGLPSTRAKDDGRFLFFPTLSLHQRYDFACDKGDGYEHRGKYDAGYGKNDFNVVVREPGTKPTLQSKKQNKDQSRNYRRHGERNVDERKKHILSPKIELRDRPGRSKAKDCVERNRDGSGQQRHIDCGSCVGFFDGFPVESYAHVQSFHENSDQRGHEEERQKSQRNQNQNPLENPRHHNS